MTGHHPSGPSFWPLRGAVTDENRFRTSKVTKASWLQRGLMTGIGRGAGDVTPRPIDPAGAHVSDTLRQAEFHNTPQPVK